MPRRAGTAFGFLAIVLLALGMRLWMPGPTILTNDEGTWLRRSQDFRVALITGDFEKAVAAPEGFRPPVDCSTNGWPSSPVGSWQWNRSSSAIVDCCTRMHR